MGALVIARDNGTTAALQSEGGLIDTHQVELTHPGDGDNAWTTFAGDPAVQGDQRTSGSVRASKVLLGAPVDALGVPNRLYIDGKWVKASHGRTMKIFDPSTEKLLARAPDASAKDVEKAVDAARRAFDSGKWSQTSGADRAKYLRAIAVELRAKQREIAEVEVANNGKPLADAMVDVSDSADCFDYYASLAEDLDREQNAPLPLANTTLDCKIRREPLGVAAAIIPWNYPLLMAAWKVAPALAAGCTVVLKPSEITPLTAMKLAEIAHEIGLPAGVLNVVPGTGAEAGKALASSKKIDKLAFTGGTATGRAIAHAAAENLIPATLELGGKSPAVVFADADLDQIVHWIAFGVFGNQGEVCSATSRLIVDEKIAPELERRLVELARSLKVGRGMDDGVKVGPLVSKAHYERVTRYIETAKREGATLLTGGGRAPGFAKGFFIEPTIFSGVKPSMTIWKEEIFGPVLAITTFKDEAEAIRLANDTEYGLAAAVFSKDKAQLDRASAQIRAGVIWQNCSQPVAADGPPWGGFKKSGIGRELGRWGIGNYLQTKAVAEYVGPETFVW